MNKWLVILGVCVYTLPGFSQNGYRANLPGFLQVNVTKTGPYFGVQQGKYTIMEIGAERLWKKIRLRDPFTQAIHMGFNYNIKYNVLGYDVGYWCRPQRIGLTYGANLFYRTDFTHNKIGIAPVVGYKFWFLHAQTGFHFMQRPADFATNTFFVSLRMSIINDRDIDIKRKKGGILDK